jgi:indolepyruvate ferredoxin oxidoreductase alpha subunit
LGIVACGAVRAYLREALEISGLSSDRVSTLRASTTTPLPREEIRALLEHCGDILVLEELEPYMERSVLAEAQRFGFSGRVVGKIDGPLSPIGEVGVTGILRGLTVVGCDVLANRESPQAIAASANRDESGLGAGVTPAPRPITVCAGCPHRGTYLAIEAAIREAGFDKDEVMVTGDIGCTILGMNPPFDLLWNEVSMGTSVSLAQGYVHAGLATPVIATIGDSTFFHGGIPGLVNAIQHNTPLTLVILDNGWTSMTGMQVNAGTDAQFQSEGGRRVDLVKVVEGLGPDRLEVVDPYDVAATTEAIAGCLGTAGVNVVIAQRECAIQARRRGVVAGVTTVDPETCVLCKKCLRVTGCPALSLPKQELGESPDGDSPERQAIEIDSTLCNGCGICSSVCPTGALKTERRAS